MLTIYSISSVGGQPSRHTLCITQESLTGSTLLDYIRYQVTHIPPPAAASINRRVGTAERAMRLEFPEAPSCLRRGFTIGTRALHTLAMDDHARR